MKTIGRHSRTRAPAKLVRGMGFFPILILSLSGCAPNLVTDTLDPRDLSPPSVTAWEAVGSREYRIDFDEDVSAEGADFLISPPLGALEVAADGNRLSILAEAGADSGGRLTLEGTVRDAAGNETLFVLPFWGYNPRLPRTLINEARTQGSSAHPDAVELRVLEPGNLAGLTFFVGTRAHSALRYVFPSCEVSAGEFIVLHLKPQGLPEEVDETEDVTASGGLDATGGARDFWYPGDDGALPGENGSMTLYASPTGSLRDALLYSARTSESDTKYSGFGTRALLDQANDIVVASGWSTEGPNVRPEDAARSSGTTSTRTLCRFSDSADTDSDSDWHVVPTKCSTIGAENSDEIYSP